MTSAAAARIEAGTAAHRDRAPPPSADSTGRRCAPPGSTCRPQPGSDAINLIASSAFVYIVNFRYKIRTSTILRLPD
jgi:hypothetical protein